MPNEDTKSSLPKEGCENNVLQHEITEN
jgi:hypothetical protein